MAAVVVVPEVAEKMSAGADVIRVQAAVVPVCSRYKADWWSVMTVTVAVMPVVVAQKN